MFTKTPTSSLTKTTLIALPALAAALLVAMPARAQETPAAPPANAPLAAAAAAVTPEGPKPFRLGAHLDVDVGLMAVMKQSAGLSGGVVWGPFRAGMSYATFLSNNSFGGTPAGFDMRVNYIIGFNASYFIARRSDDGLYVQAMFHVKQQGVTNQATGAHRDLDSLAAGLEVGYLWKFYRGLYVAPRVGALYYVKSPQGSGNAPIQIGDRAYDNGRHKVWDTYFIPTISVGYSW
jgi:hypothetical protein